MNDSCRELYDSEEDLDQCNCCGNEFLFEDLHGYFLANGTANLCDDCKFYVVIARQNHRLIGASLDNVKDEAKSDGMVIQ